MLMAGNIAEVYEALSPPTLADPVTQWCMVLVRPSLEQEARDALRRMGIGAYWPNYQRLVKVKNRRSGHRTVRSQLAPVIPGILISPAKFSEQFWSALDLAPGVLNIAQRFGGHPLILSDLDIVLIHKIEEGLNKPLPMKMPHNFKPGEKVRFSDDDLSRWGVGKINRLL